MRSFSHLEQEIITHICTIQSLSKDVAICDTITKFCPCSLKWDESSLTIFFDEDSYSQDYILNRLLTIICLFEYLQSQALIYVFKRSNVEDRNWLINKSLNHAKFNDNNISVERIIPFDGDAKLTLLGKTFYVDKNRNAVGLSSLSKFNVPWALVLLVDRYANSVMFCTETLRHIKRQDFKDDSTIQFNRNRRQTWFAILISLIVGVGGIIGNFFTYFQNKAYHIESITNPQQFTIIHKFRNDTMTFTMSGLPQDTINSKTILNNSKVTSPKKEIQNKRK